MNRTELAARFRDIQEQASSGHYLTRIIAICTATEHPDLVEALSAFKRFMDKHFKPAGVDEFIEFASRCALYSAYEAGLTEDEIKPIVWGLDWNVLKDEGLVYLRTESTSTEARSDV